MEYRNTENRPPGKSTHRASTIDRDITHIPVIAGKPLPTFEELVGHEETDTARTDTEHQEKQESATLSLSELLAIHLKEVSTSTPGLDISTITTPVERIEHQLAALIPDESIRQTIYTGCVNALATFVESGLSIATDDALRAAKLRTMSRRTNRQTMTKLGREVKKCQTACKTALSKLVRTLDRAHKLGITDSPTERETLFQAIERQLDAISQSLLHRPVKSDKNQGKQTSNEPIDFQRKQEEKEVRQEEKEIDEYLRRYNYAMLAGAGLCRIRYIEGEIDYVPIMQAAVKVLVKRLVHNVPDRITQQPELQDVVLVTQFTPLDGNQEPKEVEIHRSDARSKQPQFFLKIDNVVPPHKKEEATFIHAVEVMGNIAPRENRYNATGLVRTEDELALLNPSSGALTANGLNEQYRIQFPMHIASKLTAIAYGWKRLSSKEEQIADYRILLKILLIAPGSKGYGDVLLGIIGFCPFSQLNEDAGVWALIYGLTGSMKSATSRLILQCYSAHYGRAETSTVNLRDVQSTPFAVEQVLYYLAGMIAHLDDALKATSVSQKDIDKFWALVSIIGSHSATRQGAKRGVWGHGQGGFGVEPFPRGSGVMTTESLPKSDEKASDLARWAIVPLDGVECVDMPLLSELQEKESAEAMNRVTASAFAWALPQMESLLEGMAEKRSGYANLGLHERTVSSYAKLEMGIDVLLQYGVSIDAHTQEDAAHMLQECHERLCYLALRQKDVMGVEEAHAQKSDMVYIFYDLLNKARKKKMLYMSDAAYRKAEVVEWDESAEGHKIRNVAGYELRPQPPVFLSSEQYDITDERPDVYGWRWNEALSVYEPGAGSYEAGVLKWDGNKIFLHMYVKDFNETVYPVLRKVASDDNLPLPGLNEIVTKLKERGKLTSTPHNTNLHGRNSRSARVYVLDMTPEPEPDTEQDSSEQDSEIPSSFETEDGNLQYDFE